MMANRERNRSCGSGRLFLFLLLVVLLAAGSVIAARADTGMQVLNASGNLNIQPAVNPAGKTEGYSAILYDNRNGLPTSDANAVAQTKEGFLWIGGYAGLIRYDGNTFERMYSSTKIANVRCLYVDSQDRLWIGTNDSGIFLMERESLLQWDKDDGLESLSIRTIIEDENGLMYIASAVGVATIDREMHFSVLADERITGQTMQDLRHGGGNRIYGLTRAGDIFTMEDGRITSWLGHEECRVQNVTAIVPDPADPDRLYLGTELSQVYYGSYSKNFPSLGVKSISPLVYVEQLEWIGGQIWVCAKDGIGAIAKDGFHPVQNVPMDNSIDHVMTDSEGNLWFTSSTQGIMKIVPNRFTDLSARCNLPEAIVQSTCLYHGQLFIGTDEGLIVVDNNKRVESVPVTRAVTASGTELDVTDLLAWLDGVRIRSIFRDSANRLWISTWRSQGLVRYENGEITVFTEEDGLLSNWVRTVLECSDGSFLVAVSGGVNVIREDRVVSGYNEKDGLIVPGILTMAEAENHDLILGSDGGGIFILGSGGVRQISLEDGLSSEVILRIKRSAFLDVYWIVTSNSLAYMTPDYQVKTIRNFPYPNNYDLYENSKGDVWILASSGIYVISAEELVADGQMDPAFFSISSGLPYVAMANSRSELAPDGSLYIAGTSGVVKVNIERSTDISGELKVALPFVDADGKRYYPDESGGFTVPGNTRELTIHPYVFTFSLLDPLVTWRLEGFDLADHTVSRKELGPLSYNNLRIDGYQFVLTVKDPVSHTGRTVTYRIVKGKELTVAAIGTIVANLAALLLMAGILYYMAPQLRRKHTSLLDRLLFYLILVNMFLAAGEILSYTLEDIETPVVRELMVSAGTVSYITLVFFPYLLLLYLYYYLHPDRTRIRKTKLLAGIPCFVFTVAVLVNLKTGWLFTISEDNAMIHRLEGALAFLPAVPVWFYLILSLICMYRINRRLAALGILLIAVRAVWDFWYPDLSSTSLIYTLLLVCILISSINRMLNEEVAS